MSSERELLIRAKYTLDIEYSEDLINDIDELLTQPERKPLSDGDVEVWYSQHTWAMSKEEYMWGFRDAEIAHGITGEQ